MHIQWPICSCEFAKRGIKSIEVISGTHFLLRVHLCKNDVLTKLKPKEDKHGMHGMHGKPSTGKPLERREFRLTF